MRNDTRFHQAGSFARVFLLMLYLTVAFNFLKPEVARSKGRVALTTNMVMGGTVTDDKSDEWLVLDQKVCLNVLLCPICSSNLHYISMDLQTDTQGVIVLMNSIKNPLYIFESVFWYQHSLWKKMAW